MLHRNVKESNTDGSENVRWGTGPRSRGLAGAGVRRAVGLGSPLELEREQRGSTSQTPGGPCCLETQLSAQNALSSFSLPGTLGEGWASRAGHPFQELKPLIGSTHRDRV